MRSSHGAATAIEIVTATLEKTDHVNIYTSDSAERLTTFRVLQGAEIHAQHRAWIDRYEPELDPGIRERFAWAATIAAAEVAMALPRREAVARCIDSLLADDAIICLPTAPGIAPKLNTPSPELEVFRSRAFALLSIAGLGRLPQISLPLVESMVVLSDCRSSDRVAVTGECSIGPRPILLDLQNNKNSQSRRTDSRSKTQRRSQSDDATIGNTREFRAGQ